MSHLFHRSEIVSDPIREKSDRRLELNLFFGLILSILINEVNFNYDLNNDLSSIFFIVSIISFNYRVLKFLVWKKVTHNISRSIKQ